DVLVHAEEVVGIVAIFEGDQAGVVGSVRVRHPLRLVGGDEVHVHAARREGRYRFEQIACPGHACVVLRSVVPTTVHVHQVAGCPVRIGGGVGGEIVDGTAHLSDEDLAL